jgi:hypothetical protein
MVKKSATNRNPEMQKGGAPPVKTSKVVVKKKFIPKIPRNG